MEASLHSSVDQDSANDFITPGKVIYAISWLTEPTVVWVVKRDKDITLELTECVQHFKVNVM